MLSCCCCCCLSIENKKRKKEKRNRYTTRTKRSKVSCPHSFPGTCFVVTDGIKNCLSVFTLWVPCAWPAWPFQRIAFLFKEDDSFSFCQRPKDLSPISVESLANFWHRVSSRCPSLWLLVIVFQTSIATAFCHLFVCFCEKEWGWPKLQWGGSHSQHSFLSRRSKIPKTTTTSNRKYAAPFVK